MSRRRIAVIGYPLSHSISPRFQQPAFDARGLEIDYVARETPPSQLISFFDEFRRDETWLGLNVTVPYKEAVFGLMDELSHEARLIGAVNTVVKSSPAEPSDPRGPTLIGHNTDGAGLLRALRQDGRFDPAGRAGLLLGAGGAGRAAAVALARAGATRVVVANRHRERAERLVGELARWFSVTEFAVVTWESGALQAAVREVELLVNCTSVGMAHGAAPDQSPAPKAMLGAHLLVYDLVYNPARTPLLRDAERRGARTLGGLPMLIYQGAAAFELWTGKPAPVRLMLEHGRRALGKMGSTQRAAIVRG